MDESEHAARKLHRDQLEQRSFAQSSLLSDWCFKVVERSLIYAGVLAAARFTGSPLVDAAASVTMLLLFAWIVQSSAAASRWVKIRVRNPKLEKWADTAVWFVDVVLAGAIFMTASMVANEVAAKIQP